jgi:unsaturated rhamnogalacturonyl hydrolase
MSGLMQVYARTKDERYADYVARWADFHLPSGTQKLIGNDPGPKPLGPGYCGHWVSGTALVYLYAARNQPEYLKTASEIADFINAGATRSPEGAPGHWQGNYQLYVDTLNMTCPLLSRLSKIEGKPEYLDDAVNELLVAARHLRDEKTGLFYHMWDWQFDRRSPVQWGRGNGWVIMSLADVFEFLPKSHPQYGALKRLTLSFARSLVAVQDRDGAWHTLIDDPSSDAESSATTMIGYGLQKLVRQRVLPASYSAPARRAWSLVNQRWVRDGTVVGVSEGTGPSGKEYYIQRKLGTFTWGVGSYLMLGAEMDRLAGT